jgi:hypothetical protein
MGLCNYARAAHRPQTAEGGCEGTDDNDDQRERGGGGITRNDQLFFHGVALGAPDRRLWRTGCSFSSHPDQRWRRELLYQVIPRSLISQPLGIHLDSPCGSLYSAAYHFCTRE